MTDSTRIGPGRQALSAAISTVLSVAAGTAAAQEQPVTGLDEVIVTATRRAERLQDVSESIAAFDSAAIAMRGLKQIDDIVKYIPGMSVSQREPGGTTIVFRGVASSGIQFGAVSSSALYLDEQPITQSGRNPDPRFIDIERVEALRGPQGTLYGASSQSGTLRVITAKPDPSGFDAWTEAELTSVSEGDTGYDVSAMVNIPLAEDRISLRLVGFAAEDAGYIDNVLCAEPGRHLRQRRRRRGGHQRDRNRGRPRRAALRHQRERRPATFGASTRISPRTATAMYRPAGGDLQPGPVRGRDPRRLAGTRSGSR